VPGPNSGSKRSYEDLHAFSLSAAAPLWQDTGGGGANIMLSGQIASIFLLTVSLAPLFAQPTAEQLEMYFGDWRAATPRITHGTLEERDVLTRGDALHPPRKGAVLQFINSYSFATLAPGASTKPVRLSGQQEILYIASGHGTANAGGESAELRPTIAVLIPSNLEFTLKNAAAEPLNFYLVNEPTQPGFRPNSKMLVKDESLLPITSSSGLWDHIVKTIFVTADGLSTLESFLTVTLDPVTMGRPHVHLSEQDEIEEVWTGLLGGSIAFLGTRLFRQGPGVAYIHPPDHKTPHTNINYSEEDQVKFLYFARYRPHADRK
jgi:mannose-6-phosphate isomerase-like protein (cupin superfamily)